MTRASLTAGRRQYNGKNVGGEPEPETPVIALTMPMFRPHLRIVRCDRE